MVLAKCPECGTNLNGDCIVVWKCTECGKAFKVSISKLYKIQELKGQKGGKHLIKCSSCGHPLDNGNEKIACRCASCGNVFGGNLTYFVGDEKGINNDVETDTGTSYPDMTECPKCGKKILSDSKICSYCGCLLEEKKNTKKLLGHGREKFSDYGNKIKKYISEMLKRNEEKHKKREKKARGKFKIRLVKYILIICAIVMFVAVLAYKPLANQISYQKGVKAIEENRYDNAIEIFKGINNDAMVNESLYLKAKKLMETQEYGDAIKIFKQLKGYQDSSDMIAECHYQRANQKFSLGEYEAAADIFFALKEYKDSADKGIDSIYYSAEKCYQHEDYYTAIEILSENYSLLKNYERTEKLRDQIFEHNEWFFEKAEQEYIDGNFECANQCYIYAKKNNYKIPSPNHYSDCLRMEDIQGEFIRKDEKIFVDKFTLAIDEAEYTIEPSFLEGTDEPVGFLNEERNYYIEFPEYMGGFLIIDNREGKNERKFYESIEWYNAREEDKQRELEQQRKQQKPEPAIGMTAEEVKKSTWGEPKEINKTTYAWGTTEQWCYSNYRYIYLDDGIVTAIQE